MNQGNFISMPDSGYSVDNIAQGYDKFMIAMGNNGLGLIWNSVQDEDFQYYVIDKSANLLFQTGREFESLHPDTLKPHIVKDMGIFLFLGFFSKMS